MSQAEGLLELVRAHGVFGLGGGDGCLCAHWNVHNIAVDISCHKSSGSVKWHAWGVIRITTGLLEGVDMADRLAIATELLSQLSAIRGEVEGEPYWIVRFASYEQDAKQLCVYCGKHRQDEQSYLCNKCLVSPSAWGPQYMIADDYDFRKIHQQLEQSIPISA